MPTQIGGYEDNLDSKDSSFREVITSSQAGDKASLDVTTLNSLVLEAYDYIAITYPSTITEVYTFKTGGVGGTTVATVTLTYTDATKNNLSSAAKV